MAQLKRDARLETRNGRKKLEQRHQPYWREIHVGLAVGYRKGATGGVWSVRRLMGGKYQFQTLGHADDHQDANGVDVLNYKQAHAKALEFSTEKTSGKKVYAGGYTVEHAMADYLEHYAGHGKAYNSTKTTVDAHILPIFRNRTLASLTAEEISKWHRGLAAGKDKGKEQGDAKRKRQATANRILTVLKAALNHAWRNDRAPSADAWSKVKPFRDVDAPKIQYLTETQVGKLLAACPNDLRQLVRAALLTGCRYGELVALRCDDYDPHAGTVLVRESKSGKPRNVPLSAEGKQFFDRVIDDLRADALIFAKSNGEPWGKSHQCRPLRNACKAAEINPPASFHILRHTYASALARRGVPLQIIATALGHADTRITERHYAHLCPSHVADVIRAALPSFGVADVIL